MQLNEKTKKLKYSSDALEEINEIYTAVINSLNIAITSYATRDLEKAKSIKEIENSINSYQKNIEKNTFKDYMMDVVTLMRGQFS